MATITKTQSDTFKVQIRKIGIPAITKTCKTKAEALKWARLIESEIDRGVFIDRTEADKTTIGELIDRYIQEVTPLKKSAKNDSSVHHTSYFLVTDITVFFVISVLPDCFKSPRSRAPHRGANCSTLKTLSIATIAARRIEFLRRARSG